MPGNQSEFDEPPGFNYHWDAKGLGLHPGSGGGCSDESQRGYSLDKKAVIEIVERFRRNIEEQGITPQKVILYGSHSTASPAPESDIDVVIISEDFDGKSFWERVDVLSEAIYDLSAPLEAIAMTPDEWNRGESLIIDFAKNGEVLYPA